MPFVTSLMSRRKQLLALSTLAAAMAASTYAQQLPSPLDPTRNLPAAAASKHAALPEQYIWTAGDVTAQRPDHNKFPWNRPELRIAPHYSAHTSAFPRCLQSDPIRRRAARGTRLPQRPSTSTISTSTPTRPSASMSSTRSAAGAAAGR